MTYEYQDGYYRHTVQHGPKSATIDQATKYFHEYISLAGRAKAEGLDNALALYRAGIAYWLGALHGLRSLNPA